MLRYTITGDDCHVGVVVGAIYFGSFIAIRWTAKVLVRYAMNQYGADLADVQGAPSNP